MNELLIQQLKVRFHQAFGNKCSLLISAPGRINLIGEHTDYNKGLVFPAAIDRSMYLAFRKNNSNFVRLEALNLNQTIKIDIQSLIKSKYSWTNYLIGNLLQLQERNHKIKGFDCAFISDIPIGAGLSSSSALECGFLYGLSKLFSLNLGNWDMIQSSQDTNHKFLKVNCGFMDQFACLYGRKQEAMLLDCQDRTFNYYPLALKDHQWVLINSMVTHDHVTSAYNDRVAACQSVVETVNRNIKAVASLRDINLPILDRIKSEISEFSYNCAKFIMKENHRVREFGKALLNHDYDKISGLLYASHFGLQHQYKVSCDELDLLVDLTRNKDDVLGARMMGGGFGGCTLNLVKNSNCEETINEILKAFCEQTGKIIHASRVNISDGCKCL